MSTLIRPSLHALTLFMLACAGLLVAQTVHVVLSVSLLPLPTASEVPCQGASPALAAPTTPLSVDLLARYTGLPLNERPNPPTANSDTAPAQPAPAGPPTGFGATLRQTGPESYAIQRQDLEKTLANLNQAFTQARVLPSFNGGIAQGFKLFAIRPDSIYARLGIKNGDILRRVNGFTLDDPKRVLAAYSHLQSASQIELELERDGQPLRKTYTVEN